ncbi:MAG: hypothetical protein AAFO29_22855 [Actinomycetota bacterium]
MTTLGDLLYGPGDREDRATRLADAIEGGGLALSAAGLQADRGEVAASLARLLDMPIGNIAIRGWAKHRDVEKARAETRATPGEREVVQLASHTITSKQKPTVDISVAGVHHTILTLDLEVRIEVGLASLAIEEGEIVDTMPGPTVAGAKLSASGVVLAEHDLTMADLGQPTTTATVAAAGAAVGEG